MESDDERIARLERKERIYAFKVILALSPVIVFLVIKLLSPFVSILDLPSMHLSLTDWDLVEAGFVQRKDKSVLVLKMNNEPPGWDVAYERILTIDPDNGRVRGQVIESRPSWLLGVTKKELWVLTKVGRRYCANGYQMPDLDHIYDMDRLLADYPSVADIVEDVWIDGIDSDLRIKAQDGYFYKLTPSTGELDKLPLDPPKPKPTLVSSWNGCDMDYQGTLVDFRDCRPMFIDGDKLTLNSVKSGDTSYFVIGRKKKDGGFSWKVSDQDLFGDLDEDDPLRNLRFVTLYNGMILLVAEDGKGLDDVYAAAIDAKDGRIVWSRTFW